MQVAESIGVMREFAETLHGRGKSIALIPTMGSLHAGKQSLISAAREHAQAVVLSIYPVPMARGPAQNLERSQRDREEDLSVCRDLDVDVVFEPDGDALLGPDCSTYVVEEELSSGLCGVSLPGFFRGVCTVAAITFNIIRPRFVVLGRRNAQQVAVIGKMIANLAFPVELVVSPTIRDHDGLALSSRNARLSTHQRTEACGVFKALSIARDMVRDGVRNVDRVIAEITHHLGQHHRLRVIYVAVVDPTTMVPLREIVPGQTLIATAVWCDEIRLIDNVWL